MKLFQISQNLGVRIATGVILGLFLLMFILRVSSQSTRTTETGVVVGPSRLYLQAKYSLGGVSSFSSVSQFFLGLIFYAPIFAFAIALLLSTFLKTTLLGKGKVLGFDANLILLGISAVGLSGIFITPANSSRIYASVEFASFETLWGKEVLEQTIQHAPSIYVDLTFKFFGWYLYFLAYVFCLLLGLKVIKLVDPEEETDNMVGDIESISVFSENSEKLSAPRDSSLMETTDFGDTFFLQKGDNEAFRKPESSNGSEKETPNVFTKQFQKADEEQTEAETEIIEL